LTCQRFNQHVSATAWVQSKALHTNCCHNIGMPPDRKAHLILVR
jgi:hypothetical protein